MASGKFRHWRHDDDGNLLCARYFLLIAVRNPSAHRSLISFAAWSSLAHAAVMSVLGAEMPSDRTGFLAGSAVLVAIGVALIALAPRKQLENRTTASAL